MIQNNETRAELGLRPMNEIPKYLVKETNVGNGIFRKDAISEALTLLPVLINGQVVFQTYISNNIDFELESVMQSWVDSFDNLKTEVSISTFFNASLMLESLIEAYGGVNQPAEIPVDNLPVFLALRKELADMISKIDQLNIVKTAK